MQINDKTISYATLLPKQFNRFVKIQLKESIMNKYLLLIFTVLFTVSSYSQRDISPCGTLQGKSEWLINYQKDPSAFQRSEDVLYVPLRINLVGTNSGAGYILGDQLFGSLCTLNDDYSDAQIQFYIEGNLNYIDNSDYMFHQTILEGAQMMFDNNVENAINNYIVSEAAGNCGYNLPYAGVCLAINCTQPVDHTWAHEIGHNLSLPHPFLGWEGGVSHDGSVSHSFNNPAPERVTYDYTLFQDTLILDTLIIDTAFVEKVDGSNCTFAADGFCDTKPDYLASRWACDDNGMSPNALTDPNGEKFQSDASLIMSYANDDCSNRFTDEQIGAMRANLMDEKPHLLTNQNEPVLIDNPNVTLISPANGGIEHYENINLEWEAVDNAIYYVVRISTNAQLTSKLYSSIVQGTSVIADIPKGFKGLDIFWSVIPFNNYDFCHTFGEVGTFKTDDISSTNNFYSDKISFYPTLLSDNNILTTNHNGNIDKIRIYNIKGEEVFKSKNIKKTITLDNNLSSGLYIIEISNDNYVTHQKIVIQ
jgi:hypothetical protein